jgi:N-methylhydantoinase A
MGGTSFDVSLIVDGNLSVSTETALEGLPVLMSIVDIHTIGAGGGSLAWLEAGALRVGPRSAGAAPGPACYGLGGTQPTVTDANLLLGRLDPDYFLGGAMTLDTAAARRAIGSVAAQLGLDDEALAEGMLAVINAKMADAMRTITIRRGIDPRDYSLVAFGGAGPMHAVALAEELDISEVIVPWAPGTFSAWGMLQSDIRHDLARTFYAPLADTTPDSIEAIFADLEEQGRQVLRAEEVPDERMRFICTADMRYVGQEYFVNMVIPHDEPMSDRAVASMSKRFHDAYQIRYGHSTPDAPLELVNLRVVAVGSLPGRIAGFHPATSRGVEPRRRPVVFADVTHDAAIFQRDTLPLGFTFSGPAIVEEETATTTVPPGWQGRVDDLGNLILTRHAGQV